MTRIRTAIFAVATGVCALPTAGIAQTSMADRHWYVGGHQFNQNIAAEFGYIDFGDVSGGSAKGKAFDLVGVGTIPLGNRFGVYGKLGFAWSEVKGFGQNESGLDLTYGFGASFDLSPTVTFRGEWQKYPDAGDALTDIDVLSIGVIFRLK